MSLGILGKKIGATQLFDEQGKAVCATVVEAGPCPVLAVTARSVQLGFDETKETRVKKPLAGYFKKLNITPRRFIREVAKAADREYKVGDQVTADIFKAGDFVDVTGTSIGKGFQGGMKRWGWHGGPMTHGSMSHRRIGSIGSTTTPGRVFKGHHLPGHMGAATVTVQNLRVLKADAENNVLVIEGALPGHKNNYVIIRRAKKKKARVAVAADKKADAKDAKAKKK